LVKKLTYPMAATKIITVVESIMINILV